MENQQPYFHHPTYPQLAGVAVNGPALSAEAIDAVFRQVIAGMAMKIAELHGCKVRHIQIDLEKIP